MRNPEIEKVERELILAMKKSDVQQLDALIYDELSFVIPSGQTISKAVDLEAYRSGQMRVTEISITDQQINLTDDIAVVTMMATMSGTYLDAPIDGTYKILRVWKEFNETWKVIAGSSTAT